MKKIKFFRIVWLSKISYLLGIALIISSLIINLFPPNEVSAVANEDYKLNLSHIYCVNKEVEVHFVLLNVPDSIYPGNVIYSYGEISPTSKSGNVWHYFDYKTDGN
ncbi:MAG: hypothetical protein ACYDH1_20130, partial [Anaerolineaceae bacterium]